MKGRLFLLALGTTLLTASALGQYVRVNPKTVGYGTDVFYGSTFDRSTIVTFKAKIKGISKTPASVPSEAVDVALLVAPFAMAPDRYGKDRMIFADGYLNVELGPEWFVADQTAKLHVNDYVEITGSRMIMDGRRVVIAESVRHGHNVLALRRLSSQPYWYAPREPSTAGTAATDGTVAGTNPPIVDQPAYGNPIRRLGPSIIYGDTYPITIPGTLQGGNTLRPLQPVGNPVIIMGNYWYGGPNGYTQYPLFIRF